MARAEEALGFICGDAQPTGAKMEHPETRVKLNLDANDLRLRQDQPNDSGETFLNLVAETDAMADKLIRPKSTVNIGLAAHLSRSYASETAVFEASLATQPAIQLDLANSLGMNPLHNEYLGIFRAGSFDLQVSCKPVTFNASKIEGEHTYSLRSTPAEKRKIDRLNARNRGVTTPTGYALFLEVDLIEWNPPSNSLDQHFHELVKQVDVLKEKF